jgi:hypothetical protein
VPAALVDFRLEATLGAGLTLVDAPLATTLNPPTWFFGLAEGESATRFLSVTAAAAGDYEVDAVLAFAHGGGYVEEAHASLTVSFTGSIPELLVNAVAAVEAIPATGDAATSKAEALLALSRVTPDPATAAQAESSIEQVMRAIDRVREIPGPEASDATAPLGSLLRACQARWTALQ